MLSKKYIQLIRETFLIASSVIVVYIGFTGYVGWSDTGYLNWAEMAKSLRNYALILFLLMVAALLFGSIYSMLTGTKGIDSTSVKQANASSQNAGNPRATPLAPEDKNFPLEIRGIGTVVGKVTNDEIWNAIAEKRESFLSKNPEDYQWSSAGKISDASLIEGLAFEFAARSAVERWPVPVIVWGPEIDADNGFIPAAEIASARQSASLGVSLFVWQESENTDDGPAMLRKLFDVFDRHPDLPAVVLLSVDGTLQRQLLTKSAGRVKDGYFVPAMPNSVSAMLVTRSDRVDRLLRPFAVQETANTDKRDTQYDSIKLWNFFWEKSDGRGKDDFDAFYSESIKEKNWSYKMPLGTMSVDWWQKQLPTLWSRIQNSGPGHFTPTPYLPVRWTTWQIKEFDKAPLLGYLHRPVEVKLTGDDGKPLSTVDQIHALKAGWETATAALTSNPPPARVFFDTSDDPRWLIPVSQAIDQATASKLDITTLHQGYDIGSRIGNTGVTSQMVQISLGTISGFFDGGTSATISRRPNGTADIVMVSPSDAATKAHVQENFRTNPFDW